MHTCCLYEPCITAYLDDQWLSACCIDPDVTVGPWGQLQQLPCPCTAPAAQVYNKRDLASQHVAVTCHLGGNKQQLLGKLRGISPAFDHTGSGQRRSLDSCWQCCLLWGNICQVGWQVKGLT
jgi:hypothetical protein